MMRWTCAHSPVGSTNVASNSVGVLLEILSSADEFAVGALLHATTATAAAHAVARQRDFVRKRALFLRGVRFILEDSASGAPPLVGERRSRIPAPRRLGAAHVLSRPFKR